MRVTHASSAATLGLMAAGMLVMSVFKSRPVTNLREGVKAFARGYCTKNPQALDDKALRDNLSEKQIDKMLKDSFPASDPPSTY